MPSSPALTDLVAYLSLTGWQRESQGSVGSAWRRPDREGVLPVLNGLRREDYEWDLTIRRLGSAMGMDPAVVERHVSRMYFDVQEFRAADDVYIRGSIPMDAGFTLFSSARAIVRAAAAAARGPRVRFGGGLSQAAARVAQKARFGHTIDGSYIVPLLMPLDRPNQAPLDAPLEFEGGGVAHPLIEPEERRTTRMLAQALSALSHGVVEPGVDPRPNVVADLVATGVSREMVVAVEKAAGSARVTEFNVNFDWAGAFVPPPGQLDRVSFPHESAELLGRVARMFDSIPREPVETFQGHIIDLEDDPEEVGGRATIRTYRRGRQVRIDVYLGAEATELAHAWFGVHRHVLVSGAVKTSPGRPAWVEIPVQFAPVDEIVLFGTTSSPRPGIS